MGAQSNEKFDIVQMARESVVKKIKNMSKNPMRRSMSLNSLVNNRKKSKEDRNTPETTQKVPKQLLSSALEKHKENPLRKSSQSCVNSSSLNSNSTSDLASLDK